jgi:uncharacterized delta-60 repeat protein
MWRPPAAQFVGPWGGGDGLVTRTLAGTDEVYDAARAPDGSFVVAYNSDATSLVRLVKITPTGTIDAGFGTVTTQVDDGVDDIIGIAVQPDGRILVAGTLGTDGVVERRLATGGVDGSFGVGGIRTIDAGGTENLFGMLLQDDGRIVAVGQAQTGQRGLAVRMSSGGVIDSTFGTAGIVSWDLPGIEAGFFAVDVIDDGRYVFGGWHEPSVGQEDAIVVRAKADGSPDTTFSGDGVYDLLGLVGSDEWAVGPVHVEDDDTITLGIAGVVTNRIVRVLADGSGLDPSFGASSGTTTLPHPLSTGIVTTDGSIVLAGWQTSFVGSVLMRYDHDGIGDPSFGTNGVAVIDTHAGVLESARVVREGTDGELLVAGNADAATEDVWAGYLPTVGVADYDDSGGVDWASGAATSAFGACLRAVSGGAGAVWTPGGPCTLVDGASWNAIPTTPANVATTSALEPDPPDATAHLRFGLKVGSTQQVGAYVAPIRFEVIAPAA